jgi:hypothetical protein
MAERINDRLTVVDAEGREVLDFQASFAVLDLGARGNEGDLRLRADSGEFTFHFDGGRSLFYVRDGSGRDVLHFDGANSQLRVGAQGNDGDVYVLDNAGQASIHLDGGSGDIILQNADCAEEFDCAPDTRPEPGAVVVLDDHGGVMRTTRPYDRRVAGVVSGAGSYRPAIVLDRRSGDRMRVPVAVMGKVYCLADASYGPIRVGDLLTTSATPGHAMTATDAARVTGATVGKALVSLAAGTGLLPILVGLA